jgi:membrane fusion protein (multidrug efflux system)
MSKSFLSRFPLLILLSALIALVTYLQWPEASQKKQQRKRVVAVKTTAVNQAQFKDVVEAIGTTRANEQVLIASKYADLVEQVSFEDGQQVKQGDILVKLNNLEEVAKVNELAANLAGSEAQLQRIQDLIKSRAASKSQLDEQEAKTKAIAAQLSSAKTKLNDLMIKAPFDGILGFRQVSVGAYIRAGDVITSLDDISVIKVDFSVPERYLTTINVGQVISATSAAYANEAFSGVISVIDSRVDNITRTLKVRAEITNPDFKLRPGMLLSIEIVRQVDTVLQLPESAIIPIEDKHFVFVVNDNKVQRTIVTIGRRQPGIVELLGGVIEGEQVVIEGALKLRDGSNVNVVEQVQ